jgi:hypothetical protein
VCLWPQVSNMHCACAMLSSVAYPAVLNFLTLSHKRHDCRKKYIEHKICVWFSLQLLSETFLILSTEKYMTENVYWSSCKVPLILVQLQFSQQFFRKRFNYRISLKSFQWEPCFSMRTDRQTDRWRDMTKVIVAFRYFANAAIKCWCNFYSVATKSKCSFQR